MVATPVTLETVPSIDPATGKVCGSYERTPPLLVPQLLLRAKEAQAAWAKVPVRERCARIGLLKKKILDARDTLTDAVVRESGKPRVEAKFADIFVSLDTADYFSNHGPSLLKPESVPHPSQGENVNGAPVLYDPAGGAGIFSSRNSPFAPPLGQVFAPGGGG